MGGLSAVSDKFIEQKKVSRKKEWVSEGNKSEGSRHTVPAC